MLALAACATDDVTSAPARAEGVMTVDASTGYAYVSLADSALVTPAPRATESGAWDIAFSVTTVTLNGGAAGPGGVAAHCLCQNAAATNAGVLAMTPASELPDFEAVTAVPAGAAFSEDQLTPALAGWGTAVGTSMVPDTARVYLVRLNDSTAYAKLRVRAVGGSAAAPTMTFEYAVQPSAAGAFGATQVQTVNVSPTTTAWLDLNPVAGQAIGEGWDLRVDGWTVRVNGGVSGTGRAAVATGTQSFAATTTAAAPAQSFRTDVYAGELGTKRWYRYNIDATAPNRVHPTYDVYLLRRGALVYKLQVLGYYGPAGQPRFITFRYAQIAG